MSGLQEANVAAIAAISTGRSRALIEQKFAEVGLIKIGGAYVKDPTSSVDAVEIIENLRVSADNAAQSGRRLMTLGQLHGNIEQQGGDLEASVRAAGVELLVDLFERFRQGTQKDYDKMIVPPTEVSQRYLAQQLTDSIEQRKYIGNVEKLLELISDPRPPPKIDSHGNLLGDRGAKTALGYSLWREVIRGEALL